MCEAFSGTWEIDPTEAGAISGDRESFAHMRPPGLTEEDLKQKHKATVVGKGNEMTITIHIPGKPEKTETFTIGGTHEKELPNGAKVKATSRWENGRIHVNLETPKGPAEIERWVEGNHMKVQISKDGKKCLATFKKV